MLKNILVFSMFCLTAAHVLPAMSEDGVLVSKPRVVSPAPQPFYGAANNAGNYTSLPPAAPDSMSVDSFVNKLANETYPEVVREIIHEINNKLRLDLPGINQEQWVYNTATNAIDQLVVRQAMDRAIDLGIEQVVELRKQNVPVEEIPRMIYERMKDVFYEPEVYSIIRQKAKEFIEPILGQRIPE